MMSLEGSNSTDSFTSNSTEYSSSSEGEVDMDSDGSIMTSESSSSAGSVTLNSTEYSNSTEGEADMGSDGSSSADASDTNSSYLDNEALSTADYDEELVSSISKCQHPQPHAGIPSPKCSLPGTAADTSSSSQSSLNGQSLEHSDSPSTRSSLVSATGVRGDQSSTDPLIPPQLPFSSVPTGSKPLQCQETAQDESSEPSVGAGHCAPEQLQSVSQSTQNPVESPHNQLHAIAHSSSSKSRSAEMQPVSQTAPLPAQEHAANPASQSATTTNPASTQPVKKHRSTIKPKFQPFALVKGQETRENAVLNDFSLTSLLPRRIPGTICIVQNDLQLVLIRAIKIQLSLWKYQSELRMLDLRIPDAYATHVEGSDESVSKLIKAVVKKLPEVLKVDRVCLPSCPKPHLLLKLVKKFLQNASLIRVSIPSWNHKSILQFMKSLKNLKVELESKFEVKFEPKQGSVQDIPESEKQAVRSKVESLNMGNLVCVYFNSDVIYGACLDRVRSGIPETPIFHPEQSSSDSTVKYDFSTDTSTEEASPTPKSSLPYTFWNLGKIHEKCKGQNTILAVIDSGINVVHPAFLNAKKTASRILAVKNFSSSLQECTQDEDGHGTMCAGIACGQSFDACSMQGKRYKLQAGVAPNASLIVCKVEDDNTQVVEALEWLLREFTRREDNHNVDVISISLGSPRFSEDQARVISDLVNQHVIIVAAASNPGQTGECPVAFPAALGNVLCIGSHDTQGNISKFSPGGQHIHFLAPGESIIGPSGCGLYSFAERANIIGTSFAAPAVAGLICLIIGYIRKKFSRQRKVDVAQATHNFWVVRQILCSISSHSHPSDERAGNGVLHPEKNFFADTQCSSVINRVLYNMRPDVYKAINDKK